MPGMLQYYQETKRGKDCFWGPSSGAAYTYTHAWPAGEAENYITETRRLLDQTGQNGSNMVNWFLRDWWRELESEEAIAREQRFLAPGPGMVCGLGGSPYAKSYLGGGMPKVHSVYIAGAKRDNASQILRFAEECPTRPLFMFLFAQISPGAWHQVNEDCKKLAEHSDVQVVTMDEFALTLQDACRPGPAW